MTIAAASVTDEASDFDLAPGERWFVAHSLPRRETLARDQLRAQGFRALLPLCERTVRHARKLRRVMAPLFPRYLFVILDLDRDRWRSVNGTLGIAGLIMAHARPLAAPEGVVETLAASSDPKGAVRFRYDLKRGQTVRLVAGPFAQALGVLDRLDDRGRVELLLGVMGGVRLNVVREWVEPAA